MPLQFSVAVRNARLDAIESAIGASAILRIRSGAVPANAAAADSGTVLATLNLPADWMANASAGAKALAGTWQDLAADASGTAGHFRIYDSAGTVCHIQGTVSISGGGGDMIVTNTTFVATERFDITSFTINEHNA